MSNSTKRGLYIERSAKRRKPIKKIKVRIVSKPNNLAVRVSNIIRREIEDNIEDFGYSHGGGRGR